MQVGMLDELMHSHWSGVVPGPTPLLPTWWVQHDPRQIKGWVFD